MTKTATTAVIGAGPYGLAISAYLKAAGVPTVTFSKPMELWRNMPAGICLKSVWSASNLSDPAGRYGACFAQAPSATFMQACMDMSCNCALGDKSCLS